MNCSSCGAYNSGDANFCEMCGVKLIVSATPMPGPRPPEVSESEQKLKKLRRDLKYGDFDTKIEAIVHLWGVDPDLVHNMSEDILHIFGDAPKGLDQVFGAMRLAKAGVPWRGIIPILTKSLGQLPDSDQDPDKFLRHMIVEAMSYVRGEPEIVRILQQFYNAQSSDRDNALFALGALGDPEARDFLMYLAEGGSVAAQTATKLFGSATFAEIEKQYRASCAAA
jgi:hypothetical protein